MTEPTTASFVITSAVVVVLGPVLGPYALIVFSALAGALLALSHGPTLSLWEGVRFVALGVLIALVMTGSAVWAVERYTSIPGNVALMPVAVIIGAGRTVILEVMEGILKAVGVGLSAWLIKRGGGDPRTQMPTNHESGSSGETAEEAASNAKYDQGGR